MVRTLTQVFFFLNKYLNTNINTFEDHSKYIKKNIFSKFKYFQNRTIHNSNKKKNKTKMSY